jgi:hypothetical protein
MKATDEFSEYYGEQVDGVYECVDRVVINAYFALGQSGGGFRHWWRQWQGSDEGLSNESLKRMAGEFSRRLRGWAKKHGVPVVDTRAGERKDELAKEPLAKAEGKSGVFLILVGAAPAPVWNIVRDAQKGHIIDIRHHRPWRYANYYHFHILDKEWGHVVVRMCGYPPYGAQVIVNGHEWVDLKARRAGVALSRDDNSFVDADTYATVNRLNAQLERGGQLEEVCDRWLYSACLCFGLTRQEQRASGFTYRYSLYQLELSRNYLFSKGSVMDEVYQQLLDRTRNRLDVERLKTIFGSRQRPRITLAKARAQQRGRRAAEVSREVRRLEHDLTVLKVHWDKRTLKLYDKGERLLRVEMVLHNVKALKRRRGLPDLGEIAEIMRQTLSRFMGVVQVAHVATVDRRTYEKLSEPGQVGTQRMAGIQMTNVRMRSVMDTVVALSTCPEGFTLEQVAAGVRSRRHWHRGKYGRRQAAYDLKKLRAKRLVAKRRKSRCYELTPESLGLLCGMATLHDRVLVPILTIMSRCHKHAALPSDPHPVDQRYEQIRQASMDILRHHGVAA